MGYLLNVVFFLVNVIRSLLVTGLIAKWYLSSRLAGKSLEVTLSILIISHAFRHIDLTFLTPVVVGRAWPIFSML